MIDYATFAWPTWGFLAAANILSALIFVALAWPWRVERTRKLSFAMLTILLLTPAAFCVFSLFLFAGIEMHGLTRVSANLYSLLPFIIIAGLSLFPLTASIGVSERIYDRVADWEQPGWLGGCADV